MVLNTFVYYDALSLDNLKNEQYLYVYLLFLYALHISIVRSKVPRRKNYKRKVSIFSNFILRACIQFIHFPLVGKVALIHIIIIYLCR